MDLKFICMCNMHAKREYALNWSRSCHLEEEIQKAYSIFCCKWQF